MGRLFKVVWTVLIGMGLFTEGCGQADHSAGPEFPSKPEQSGPVTQRKPDEGLSDKLGQPPVKASLPGQPSQPAPSATIPKVVMDEVRRATFRVWVGDALPDGQLQNLQGQPLPLRNFWGPRLTVVVFWNSQSISGLEELQDLAKDLLPKYREKGLRVVAINVGEEASTAANALPKTASDLPVLVDPTGQYFAQIAQQSSKPDIPLLPRTYVVDAQGKVLWLDIGYGEATLRGIGSTVEAVVGRQEAER
ncbi:MAG: TlpA family protein disulfide reductase [Thermoguttaceae bacterium]|nr:TlpA family protein disulfide reductase [Thermoguttaceae bacterium]MDW8037846.1 TlpA disulfide reductase family protein [Thermoguttaceae bacterium]